MEINMSNNGFGNIGIGREALDTTTVGAKPGAMDASKVSNPASLRVLTQASRSRSADLVSAEPVANVPDSALSRDDALGKLVNSVFGLPPPPMPNFS